MKKRLTSRKSGHGRPDGGPTKSVVRWLGLKEDEEKIEVLVITFIFTIQSDGYIIVLLILLK